jgi:hypothetical protein
MPALNKVGIRFVLGAMACGHHKLLFPIGMFSAQEIKNARLKRRAFLLCVLLQRLISA